MFVLDLLLLLLLLLFFKKKKRFFFVFVFCCLKVCGIVLPLELLALLLERPTDDSVELAVEFVKECGLVLSSLSSQVKKPNQHKKKKKNVVIFF